MKKVFLSKQFRIICDKSMVLYIMKILSTLNVIIKNIMMVSAAPNRRRKGGDALIDSNTISNTNNVNEMKQASVSDNNSANKNNNNNESLSDANNNKTEIPFGLDPNKQGSISKANLLHYFSPDTSNDIGSYKVSGDIQIFEYKSNEEDNGLKLTIPSFDNILLINPQLINEKIAGLSNIKCQISYNGQIAGEITLRDLAPNQIYKIKNKIHDIMAIKAKNTITVSLFESINHDMTSLVASLFKDEISKIIKKDVELGEKDVKSSIHLFLVFTKSPITELNKEFIQDMRAKNILSLLGVGSSASDQSNIEKIQPISNIIGIYSNNKDLQNVAKDERINVLLCDVITLSKQDKDKTIDIKNVASLIDYYAGPNSFKNILKPFSESASNMNTVVCVPIIAEDILSKLNSLSSSIKHAYIVAFNDNEIIPKNATNPYSIAIASHDIISKHTIVSQKLEVKVLSALSTEDENILKYLIIDGITSAPSSTIDNAKNVVLEGYSPSE